MKYYMGNSSVVEYTKQNIIPIFSQLELIEEIDFDNISNKIYELEKRGTPIGRETLDTGGDVLQHIEEHITIYEEISGIILGVVTFYINNDTLCIDTLCTPFIPQAKGVSGVLLNVIKDILVKLNLKQIYLASLKTSEAFYKKNGFVLDPHGIKHKEYRFIDMVYENSCFKRKTKTKK
jgi:N-acetylglutamate synthase-like GNAT family acetyltransferase